MGKVEYSTGIDIGKSGAIVTINSKLEIVEKNTIPLIKGTTEIDITTLNSIIKDSKSNNFYIERVHSIFGSSAKSNFSFGTTNGLIIGLVHANKKSYTLVNPKDWQKVAWEGVAAVRKGKKVDTKATSSIACARLFPNESFRKQRSEKDHDGLVDAVLISYYGLKRFS